MNTVRRFCEWLKCRNWTPWSEGVPAGVVVDYVHEFTLVLDKERDDDETPLEDYVSVCLHCLIDERPELGRAIDLAKRTGNAYCVDGEWKEKNVEVLKAYPASKDGTPDL